MWDGKIVFLYLKNLDLFPYGFPDAAVVRKVFHKTSLSNTSICTWKGKISVPIYCVCECISV